MDANLLKVLYGTDDGKTILRGKCSEKQVRAMANGKSGSGSAGPPNRSRSARSRSRCRSGFPSASRPTLGGPACSSDTESPRA